MKCVEIDVNKPVAEIPFIKSAFAAAGYADENDGRLVIVISYLRMIC